MDSIISYFSGVGIDFWSFLKFAGIVLLGAILISSISRFIFRKRTLLGHAVSSSIAIVFIYVVMVLILTVLTKLQFLITPLPFVSFGQEAIHFFCFDGADYTVIASELLGMIILAFCVNLAEMWLPKGKNILSWTFWRVMTVAVGFLIHYGVNWLFHKYLPLGIVTYAPVILLAILLIMLLTGALKFLLGLILATVNPLIGALYTFFFANIVGKQVTKAVLTTGIMTGMVYLLQDFGITALSVHPEALVAYIPFLLILIPVWYLVCKI